VPIGEALAEARQQAGLTIGQVSERTRIRETIIRGIEDDDYSACGGDFYARGNIRSIAKAIGADSEPLIREYDALHRAPDAVSAVSLDELLASSARPPQRRRADQPVTWGLTPPAAASPRRKASPPAIRGLTSAAVASVRRRVNAPAARERTAAAYTSARRRVNLPAMRERTAAAYTSARRRANLPAARERTAAAYTSARRRVNLPAARAYPIPRQRANWAVAVLGLALVVVLGLGVYRLVSGPQQAAVTPAAAGKHAVAHHHARRARPRRPAARPCRPRRPWPCRPRRRRPCPRRR